MQHRVVPILYDLIQHLLGLQHYLGQRGRLMVLLLQMLLSCWPRTAGGESPLPLLTGLCDGCCGFKADPNQGGGGFGFARVAA